jgi:hypothetical protein
VEATAAGNVTSGGDGQFGALGLRTGEVLVMSFMTRVKLSGLVAQAFLPVQASTGKNACATKAKNG